MEFVMNQGKSSLILLAWYEELNEDQSLREKWFVHKKNKSLIGVYRVIYF